MTDQSQNSAKLKGLVDGAMEEIARESTQEADFHEQEAERRQKRARRKRLAAAILLPLLVLLTALNLSGYGLFTLDAPTARSPSEVQDISLQLLSDAVDELEVLYAETGRYPARPALLGPEGAEDADDQPFSYELLGPNRYILSVSVDGQTLTFDSRDDPDVVFAGMRR